MTSTALSEVAKINPRGVRPPMDEEISFVGMADLSAETGVAGPGVIRPFAEVAKGYTVFRDGDLLVAKITPCFENGKTGQAQLRRPTGVGSTEFHVVRPNSKFLDSRYALHFLRQDWIRRAGKLRMTGSGGQRRVPAAFIADLQVPLPSIEEQRRIAAILDSAEEIRSKSLAVRGVLDGLVLSATQQMLSQTDGQTSFLGDVADVQGGLQVTAGRHGNPIVAPYLRVANVRRGMMDLAEIKQIRVTQQELDRVRLRVDDLLLVEGHGNHAEVGRAARWRGQVPNMLHQNHLIRVRPHEGVLMPSVLEALINSSTGRSHFARAGKTTSGLNTISTSNVRALRLPKIPLTLQESFTKLVESLDDQRARLDVRDRAMDQLFDSLQARAFSGRL